MSRQEQFDLGPAPSGRRGPYGLHEAHVRKIMDVLRKKGAIYLGPAYGSQPFTFATKAFPEVCYHSNGRGDVRGHTNACSHNKYPLITGEQLDQRISKQPGELTVCPFHSLAFDLGTGNCVGYSAATLPKGIAPTELSLKPENITVCNGFVFRLGDDDPEGVEFALREAFASVDEVFPGLFSIDAGNPSISGYEFRAISEPQHADVLTGLINYLDIFHIASIHPQSLGQVCTIEGYQSLCNEHVIVQWLPLKNRLDPDRSRYGMEFWSALGESSFLTSPVTNELLGAVWVTFRQSGLMLEWYPGVIVVSQCFPGWSDDASHENDPRRSTFHHHFFYEDMADEAFIRAHQDLFKVTGDEDEKFCRGTSAAIFREIERGKGDTHFGFACSQYENYATQFYVDVARLLQSG